MILPSLIPRLSLHSLCTITHDLIMKAERESGIYIHGSEVFKVQGKGQDVAGICCQIGEDLIVGNSSTLVTVQ